MTTGQPTAKVRDAANYMTQVVGQPLFIQREAAAKFDQACNELDAAYAAEMSINASGVISSGLFMENIANLERQLRDIDDENRRLRERIRFMRKHVEYPCDGNEPPCRGCQHCDPKWASLIPPEESTP